MKPSLILTNLLRLASVPVGIVIGLWTAALTYPLCASRAVRFTSCALNAQLPTFAAWECALFGAGAAAAFLLASEAVHRLTPC